MHVLRTERSKYNTFLLYLMDMAQSVYSVSVLYLVLAQSVYSVSVLYLVNMAQSV